MKTTSNKAIFIVFLIAAFTFISSKAQKKQIYLPSEIQKLYNGNTRSLDGKPGPDYWQNSADYKISVELIPEYNLVSGKETINYFNNSPDTLSALVIQVFQDFYKKGFTRDSYISETDLNDGVEILNFAINDEVLEIDSAAIRRGTNLIIPKLPQKVAPNSSIKIYFEWEFNLPVESRQRMGKYGDNTFFVAYWYPKVAVYDDVDGWDILQYTGRTEFYSDKNNYSVDVTVPSNFLVWATGELQNADEVLTEGVLEKYHRAQSSDEVVRIVTENDYENENVTLNNNESHWKFSAEGVPDFSFCLSDHYLWDGTSVQAGKNSSRVFTDVAYAPGTVNYDMGAELSRRCVEYLSNELPGIAFPYPHMTTFCRGGRGGGMETPMMANNGAPSDSARFAALFFHEIAHTYFPFYVYTNERKFEWMDEGWASFFPAGFTQKYYKNYSHYNYMLRYYKYLAEGKMYDVPIMVPSDVLSGTSLYAISYGKTFLAIYELQNLLGKELFKKALQEYMSRWAGKHPLPYDFFFTFDDAAGENLSWFWNPWFYEFGNCDFALIKGKDDNGRQEVIVKKMGLLPAHIVIELTYSDGSKGTVRKSTDIWKDGKDEFIILNNFDKTISSAELITNDIPDLNSDNNVLIFD